MSSKTKVNNGQKKDNFRPRNHGAAGFSKIAWRGKEVDHVNEFMKFRTSWTDYVTTAYDTKLECIVKFL